MTKSQTYSTRHLTAQDHRLIDALEADPRYRKVANLLRPPVAKPTPKVATKGAAQPSPTPPPAPTPQPTPTPPTPAAAPAKPVAGMTTSDAPGLGRKGR